MPGFYEFASVVGHAAQHNSSFALLGPSAQAISNRIGLLKNFLEHEMLVRAQFIFFEFVFKLRNHRADLDVINRGGTERIGLDDGHLVVIEIDDLPGVLNDCAGIGCDDVFIIAHADDQRAAFAGDHQSIRFIFADDGNTIGAIYFMQRCLHSALKYRHARGESDPVFSIRCRDPQSAWPALRYRSGS